MSLYKTILNKAWNITWSNKSLWFFGLFAVLLGSGGGNEIFFRSLSDGNSYSVFPGFQKFIETGVFNFQNLSQTFNDNPFGLITIAIVFLLILILFGFLIWLAVISQTALVSNSASLFSGKKADFKTGVTKARGKFLSVLGLNIVIKAIVCLAFLLISIPLIASMGKQGLGLVGIAYIVVFIILVIAVLSLTFVIKYSIAYVVIKNKNIQESIKMGWDLFVKNWLVSIEMAIVLFFINFVTSLFVVLILLTLAIPFFFLGAVFYKIAADVGLFLVSFFGLIILLLVIVLPSAVLSAFQISSWTGLFIQLIGKGGESKIKRLFDDIKDKLAK